MFQLIKFTPEVECRALVSVEDKCYFILHTADCNNAQGLINYLSFLYCNVNAELFTGGVFILGLWMLFLFIGLATAANSFFCPSLQVIAKKLSMSDNVAGVTLLALGNGAPDIFSSLAGIRQGRAELAFGELFGAGILVTTVVAGSICFIKPFHVMERPFLRDCVFYLVAVYFVFWVFFHHYVHLGHAIGFIVFYIVYVVVVIVGRFWNSRITRSYRNLSETPPSSLPINDDEAGTSSALPIDDNTVPNSTTVQDDIFPVEVSSVSANSAIVEDATAVQTPAGFWQNVKDESSDFINCLKPFTVAEWSEMKWYEKITRIAEAPFNVILRLTIPLVSQEAPRNGWCRSLQCLQMGITPSWTVWAIGYGDVFIANMLSLPLMIFIIGSSLGILLAIFSRRKQEPAFHWLFSFASFVVAIVWIDLIANEILAVLFTFGVVFQLSDAILGLTILAWGNSIGDFVADVAMARQNAPRMGFSACYGAPLLNTLLGLGISFVIACGEVGGNIPVTFHHLSL